MNAIVSNNRDFISIAAYQADEVINPRKNHIESNRQSFSRFNSHPTARNPLACDLAGGGYHPL